MSLEIEKIEFDCQVRQVKSMSDHSVNVTFNVQEYHAELAGKLLNHIDDFGTVVIVIEPKRE